MHVIEAIRTRRSNASFRQDPIPEEILWQILEAATWAPNHYKTEPWRFVVLTGDGRAAFGEVVARRAALNLSDPDAPAARAILDKERRKPLEAPAIIAVGRRPRSVEKALEHEEIAATAAAVQNMMLTAHALGLASKWRTGAPARDEAIVAFLGFEPGTQIVAFLYLGYPAAPPDSRHPTSVRELVRWLDKAPATS